MNRIGFMVNTGCFPTREAAEAKKKLLEQKGVNSMVEDIDALTMRELVTAIMCVEKQLQLVNETLADIRAVQYHMDSADATLQDNSVKKTSARALTPFGMAIVAEMDKKKLTHAQLAAMAGVSNGSVTRVLYTDQRPPSEDIFAKIAIAAGVPYSKWSQLIANK